jgi:hypothetical protein
MATLQQSTPPPAPVYPIPTLVMEAFLARPVTLWQVCAHDILNGVEHAWRGALKPRRRRIEEALERLEDLRERLIAKLDALDGDPDLEPWLSASDGMNQRFWATLGADDREVGDDDEPYLSATNIVDQRAWSLGGATDLEDEHDGREPEIGEGCYWPDEGDQSTFCSLRPYGA